MDWKIFLFSLGVNTIMCLLQFFIQEVEKGDGKLPRRHSIIPGTDQKFLYWQDFYTQTYGDLIGLMLVLNGFLHIFNRLRNAEIFIFAVIGLIAMIAFFAPRLSKNHKPSWGEPRAGQISFGGFVHSFYSSLLSAMSCLCLWSIITGRMAGVLLWLTLVGGIIWVVALIMDTISGNFDPLKITHPIMRSSGIKYNPVNN